MYSSYLAEVAYTVGMARNDGDSSPISTLL